MKDSKEKVIDNFDRELTKFYQNLLIKTPEEIVNKAYEFTIKYSLLNRMKANKQIENNDFDMMVEKNITLDDLYTEIYLKSSNNIDDEIEDCINANLKDYMSIYRKEEEYEK